MLDRSGFRGWWIVGVGFCAQAITVGLTVLSYAVFLTPISNEFDTSIMVANLGLSLVLVTITLGGPIVGRLLDRGSIRAIMTCGACCSAAAFAGMSQATELWQLGAGMCLAAVGMVLSGPLATMTVVAKWFVDKRGMATGIAAMGPPAGGLILVPLAGLGIEEFGWRTTLHGYALAAILMAPLHWWVIRNSPGELGQSPDGAGAEGGDVVASPLSARDILARRDFWLLALGAGILIGVNSGWSANAVRFVEDLGHAADRASLLVGLSMGMGIPATLFFGAMSDRFDNRALFVTAIALQVAGLLWLRDAAGFGALVPAFALLGLGAGGLLPMFASLIGRLFGSAAFGQVFGFCNLVMLPFGSLAAPLIGATRDATGSYDSAVLAIAASYLLAGSLLLALRMRPQPQAG